MAILPPWALHVGAANCFNRLTAIGMATAVTADDTSVTFTAITDRLSLLPRPANRPIVPALKNAGHTDRRQ
jgi:hypothetical protein